MTDNNEDSQIIDNIKKTDNNEDSQIIDNTKKTDNNEDSQIIDNTKKTDKYVMNNTDLDNTKVFINKDNVLESKKAIYEYLPLHAHCNKYDIEKWQDWFCIPNYYINNNYVEGEKALIDIDTNDVSICYKPCYINDINDSLIIKRGNIKQCVYKSSYLNGKYSNYTIFDPFSIICLFGSTPNTIKDIHKKGSYLYKLNEISKKTDNSNWNNEEYELAKDINTNDINIIDNVIKNPAPFISSIITDIEKSKDIYVLYIKNIIDTLLIDELIKKKISEDILDFNNLLISNDFYYMTYLNKISNNYGIDYAFEISNNINDNTASNNGISDKLITKDLKKYVNFALKYSCYVCFSKQSEYYNNMIKKVNIIKEGSIIISPDREDICQLPNMEIDIVKSQNIILKHIDPIINKNDIVLFSMYNNIYEYLKTTVITINIIIITVVVFTTIIALCIYIGIIHLIIYGINFSYIVMFEIKYILIYIISHILYFILAYGFAYLWSKVMRYILILLSFTIFIYTMMYVSGKQNAIVDMFNLFADIITGFSIFIIKFILFMYNTYFTFLPFILLFIHAHMIAIMPQYTVITQCDYNIAIDIFAKTLILYKTNFYKDNLTAYNDSISEYKNNKNNKDI